MPLTCATRVANASFRRSGSKVWGTHWLLWRQCCGVLSWSSRLLLQLLHCCAVFCLLCLHLSRLFSHVWPVARRLTLSFRPFGSVPGGRMLALLFAKCMVLSCFTVFGILMIRLACSWSFLLEMGCGSCCCRNSMTRCMLDTLVLVRRLRHCRLVFGGLVCLPLFVRMYVDAVFASARRMRIVVCLVCCNPCQYPLASSIPGRLILSLTCLLLSDMVSHTMRS